MELIDLLYCYNFSISNNLTQMVNIPTWTMTLTVLLFCICFFLLMELFVLQWLVVSVSFDFLRNSKRDALFHCIAYGNSCTDWDGLCDHLMNDLQEDIFQFSASAAASKFCERVLFEISVFIPHHKYHSNLTHLHGFQLLLLLP